MLTLDLEQAFDKARVEIAGLEGELQTERERVQTLSTEAVSNARAKTSLESRLSSTEAVRPSQDSRRETSRADLTRAENRTSATSSETSPLPAHRTLSTASDSNGTRSPPSERTFSSVSLPPPTCVYSAPSLIPQTHPPFLS